jgi:phosphoribosylamine--glycine ligase
MGAYSPAPVMTSELIERTMREIVEPTMRGMAGEGAPFSGILFAGLMITDQGPKLIEYNVRFGDPECQVLMMRLKEDLLVLLNAAVDGQLAHVSARWDDAVALTVVMAAKGYPGTPEKGSVIKGVDQTAGEGVEIFHAGTAINAGALVANGGRVLNVTAAGPTAGAAQARVYDAIDRIDWPQGFYRHDIGWRAIEREDKTEPS